MKKLRFVALPLVGCLVLASCQSFGSRLPSRGPSAPTAPPPVATAQGSDAISGTWVPTDEKARGVYVAQFRDGVFVSTSPTTKKPLAKGRYVIVSDTSVKLDFVGAASGTAVQANCERQSETTLYCVPTLGSPFTLSRTA